MSGRIYVEGDIWEDRDGDEWEVQEDGTLFCGPLDWYRTPEQVENGWGPLVLKTPAEYNYDAEVMADISSTYEYQFNAWAKEAMEHLNSYEKKPKPMVFDLSEELAERLDQKFVYSAVATYDEALHLLLKKNADYGPKNISESPGGPLNGLRVRMWDKMARINNLLDSGVEPENESLRDSFQDLGNYCFIALMVLDGTWPGANEASAGEEGTGNGS